MGVRNFREKLELKIVDKIAALMEKERWDIFTELDDGFESVASSGVKRLERSKNISNNNIMTTGLVALGGVLTGRLLP